MIYKAVFCEKAKEMGPVTVEEVGEFIKELSAMPFVKPILEDARTKMASRDFALRDVYHDNDGGHWLQ